MILISDAQPSAYGTFYFGEAIYGGERFITDRTEEDKNNGTYKGYYTSNDLRRVEINTRTLSRVMLENGYAAPVDVKTNWYMGDFPTDTEMRRYIENVYHLVRQYSVLSNTPDLPYSMNYLHYSGANSIEKNLRDLNQLLENMISVLRFSGQFASGSMETVRGYTL